MRLKTTNEGKTKKIHQKLQKEMVFKTMKAISKADIMTAIKVPEGK